MAGKVHLVAQSTGGAGKTFTSVALAQYLISKNAGDVLCLDTDPATPKFVKHAALNVKHIDISSSAMDLDRSRFDDLIEEVTEHNGECVVDSGASNFLPLMSYLITQDVVGVLESCDVELVMHAPLMGGDAFAHTLNGLNMMLSKVPANFVVWENEWRGPVAHDGRDLYQSKAYKDNVDRVLGVVKIMQRQEDLYSGCLREMTSRFLTFSEAEMQFKKMQAQRVRHVRDEIYGQLAAIGL